MRNHVWLEPGVRVLVTGASGFVGSNLAPLLRATGCTLYAPSHGEADLLEQAQVRKLLAETGPELVIHLAGRVGGILANRDSPADFCRDNLLMGTLVLHEAWQAGAAKFLTLMGGCSYPGEAPSPIKEDQLWCGYPAEESAPYSLAKAMVHEMARAYRRQYGFNAVVLVPGNLYGPHDNFDLQSAHVIPALIRKYVEARERRADRVVAWGTGRPVRDFVYVEDVCRAIMLAIERYDSSELINISSGQPVAIRRLVELIADVTGYDGEIEWDSSKPDGQMEKGFDVIRMRELLGFECTTPLREGLQRTVQWYLAHRPAPTAAGLPG